MLAAQLPARRGDFTQRQSQRQHPRRCSVPRNASPLVLPKPKRHPSTSVQPQSRLASPPKPLTRARRGQGGSAVSPSSPCRAGERGCGTRLGDERWQSSLTPRRAAPRGVQVAPLISDDLSALLLAGSAPRPSFAASGSPHQAASPHGLPELVNPRNGNAEARARGCPGLPCDGWDPQPQLPSQRWDLAGAY